VTFRLYPKSAAVKKLLDARQLHKHLYNAAIANRKTQYERFGHSVNYYEQQNSLPAFKQVWPEYQELGSHALQATLKPVDLAYQVKVEGVASPDDPNLEKYWEKRATKAGQEYWGKNSKNYQIAVRQKWHCPVWGEHLFNGEELETHHKTTVKDGGGDGIDSLIHLHKSCHVHCGNAIA
jgi:transposase